MMPNPSENLESLAADLLASLPQENDAACLWETARHLSKITQSGQILRDEYRKTRDESDRFGYGNHLIYSAPDDVFHIRAMVFASKQVTPIHDHRVWCCLVCLDGEITEHFYNIDGEQSPHVCLAQTRQLAPGDTSQANPQCSNIHALENLSADPAITIHVYAGPPLPSARKFYEQAPCTAG